MFHRLLLLLILLKLTGGYLNDKVTFKHSGQHIVTKRLLENYSKEVLPRLDVPTQVKLGIYVNSFYSISEQTMDYSVILYLRQSWVDPRLSFKSPDGKLFQMKMGEYYWQNIWIPDVFFRNEKKASYHDITVPNRLLRINSTGAIWYTIKISATLSCPMRFEKYPLDTQRCPLLFESFGYSTKAVNFTWLDNPVDVDKGLQLPQFSLVDKKYHDCTQNYTTGTHSCISIEFVLHRDIGYFIIQVYVPSMLIVILSWVSFWISIDAHPARVSLGLLTVLTTTTMSGGARESLPRVSYIKAIDIWMIVCLTFVFASLLEYAVVNVLARQVRASALIEENDPASKELLKIKKNKKRLGQKKLCFAQIDSNRKRARQVDKFSRKAFPICFIIFNIVYWIAYTTRSN
uniref:Putative GABA receptor 3 n=1 Tax=Hirudo verbana TaxID=311461 RepID=A0A2S1WM69_9ANNE|nr:putative GABA receptor 3 [Hirudo verbana]